MEERHQACSADLEEPFAHPAGAEGDELIGRVNVVREFTATSPHP